MSDVTMMSVILVFSSLNGLKGRNRHDDVKLRKGLVKCMALKKRRTGMCNTLKSFVDGENSKNNICAVSGLQGRG